MVIYVSLGDVIEKIAQDYGINALFDVRLVIAVFTDLAPMMCTETELLRTFLKYEGAQKIILPSNESIGDSVAIWRVWYDCIPIVRMQIITPQNSKPEVLEYCHFINVCRIKQ